MPKNNKGQYIAKKGKPSGAGHDKAGLKEVDHERLDEQNRIEDEYQDGPDTVSANVHERHINRNLDKPDINKPSYS